MINHIDIVIPCFNVEHIVDKCIESVLKQECEQNISIYLIEDGSTDNTKGVLLRFSTHSKINIIFHTKNKGLAAARNSGIKAGCGDVIFFLDSDMTVDSNWISNFLIFLVDKDVKGIVGEQKLPFELNETPLDKYLYSNYRGARQFGEHDFIHFKYFLFSNTCVRRSVFNEVGFFDEKFRTYGGEDTDLALRIWKKYSEGFRFSRKSISYHWDQKSKIDFYKNMELYGNNNFKYLIEKHPEYKKDFGGGFIDSFMGKILFNYIISNIIFYLDKRLNHPALTRYMTIFSTIKGSKKTSPKGDVLQK